MKLIKLAPTSDLFQLFSHKITIDYTDLIAAGLTQTLTPLFKASVATGIFGDIIGNRHAILRSGWRLITPFAQAALSSLTFTLGDVANTARFIAAASTDCFTALATNTKNNGISNTAYAYAGADGITNTILKSAWTAVGVNLGNGTVTGMTAGKLEMYFKMADMSTLQRPI
jgi:hypothetical protein